MLKDANSLDAAHMISFCDTFKSLLEGTTVEQLWCDFKEALNEGINKFIPNRFVGSKRHLPWITQAVKRVIRKRDHLYQKSKTSKDAKDHRAFLNSKHGVKQKLKFAHNKYLEDILGLNDQVSQDTDTRMSRFSRKKLSILKSSRTDSQSIPFLKKGKSTFTQSADQADVLNS